MSQRFFYIVAGTRISSFLCLNNILYHICTIFCLSTVLLMDTWLLPPLSYCESCYYEHWCPSNSVPYGHIWLELLGHMVFVSLLQIACNAIILIFIVSCSIIEWQSPKRLNALLELFLISIQWDSITGYSTGDAFSSTDSPKWLCSCTISKCLSALSLRPHSSKPDRGQCPTLSLWASYQAHRTPIPYSGK